MSKFTNQEKHDAIMREIKYREWVFPKRVAEGKMKQNFADRQIAIFEEIAADYQDEELFDENQRR